MLFTQQKIIFSKPLHAEQVPPHNPTNKTPRSVIKNNTFQDHCLQDHHLTTSVAPLQDHSTGVAPLQDHKTKCLASFQDPLSVADVKDIFTLKKNSSHCLMQLAICQEGTPSI